MNLNELLSLLGLNKTFYNHKIKKIAFDYNKCINNSIYYSLNDNLNDIKKAINNGAKTIFCSKIIELDCSVNVIIVENIRKILALSAKYFYNNISKKLKIIGVIGTNGKTSTSTIGYDFFNYINYKSMLIGSNGIFYEDKHINIKNTTPDIITIYDNLVLAFKKKIKYIFIEISSIAIDQFRTYGLELSVLIFTNFSQDHLDYHKNIYNYLYTKLIPFIKMNKNSYVIINNDDETNEFFKKYCDSKIISYSENNKSDIKGYRVYNVNKYATFYYNNILFKNNLIGSFNILNCLSIIALMKIFKISLFKFKDFLIDYKGINGRMNQIEYKCRYIIIDYAHTFSATKTVIEEFLKVCKNNLYIVIGCGGNREKEKRFMIGSYLNNISANITLTVDNPRFEDPIDIINDIKKNIDKNIEIILDRKTAIIYNLNKLKPNDYLLILGKGAEEYIEIKNVRYQYSDKEVVYDWIKQQ